MLGAEGWTLRNVIGEPSDSKRKSYCLPFLSLAVQVMLETCPIARFPICLHIPDDNSMIGTGKPSTFGLCLEFKSIRSIGNSYKF